MHVQWYGTINIACQKPMCRAWHPSETGVRFRLKTSRYANQKQRTCLRCSKWSDEYYWSQKPPEQDAYDVLSLASNASPWNSLKFAMLFWHCTHCKWIFHSSSHTPICKSQSSVKHNQTKNYSPGNHSNIALTELTKINFKDNVSNNNRKLVKNPFVTIKDL